MASRQAEEFAAALRSLRMTLPADDPPLEAMRAASEQVVDFAREPTGVSYRDEAVAGMRGRWAEPDDARPMQVVLYAHGGGYSACSVDSHRRLMGHLAKAAGCRVLGVDYRLAPEHPHPAALEDLTSAYRWLLESEHRPTDIAIAGDSAGGGLAVATLLSLRDDGMPLPAAAVVFSPWTDMTLSGESMISRSEVDVLLTLSATRVGVTSFLASGDPHDPLASPLYGDLTGLPPLYVQVGDYELLLDDALRLAERARIAGVHVMIEVFPEMLHVFQLAAGNIPEADEAIGRAGAWLAAHLNAAVIAR